MKDREMNGFLDRGTMFKGELTFEDMLRIDGRFDGTIRSESALIVGEGAEISGEVHVSTITINGQVSGIVRASSRVEINGNARVKGEIHTPSLAIQDGAVFDGTVYMTEKPLADSKAAPKTAKAKDKAE